tara:strand:- start:2926 stop:3777 length:852 start_codon:yes stop_codon:yes gene_type:complete
MEIQVDEELNKNVDDTECQTCNKPATKESYGSRMNRSFSPNETYSLYDMYADTEREYKTNWDGMQSDKQAEYLKKLYDEGFQPIPKEAAMEYSEKEYRDMYTKKVEDGTLHDIPINPRAVRDDVDEGNEKKKLHINRLLRESHPAERSERKIENLINRSPERMTKEEEKTKFTLTNVINYFRAEQSLATQGPVSLTVFKEREKICGECPHRKTHDKIPDPLGFCTKCGCGANPRARLTNKIKMPQTSCPLNKWGTSTGIYKGVFGKLRHKLTPKSKREELDYT